MGEETGAMHGNAEESTVRSARGGWGRAEGVSGARNRASRMRVCLKSSEGTKKAKRNQIFR